MSKTAFILICIALVLFMLFVPNYIAPDTPGEAGKWEFSNIELRAFMFATIILPVFFIIIYSDNLDFNVAPPYIPFIERKNLWGTLAFLALCVSSGLFQIMGDGSLQKFPLENNLLLFSIVAAILLALRSALLDGVWGIYLNRNFTDRCIKFFRTVIILLFVVAVALAFVLPLLGTSLPSTAQINETFADIKFVVNEEFTATFTILLMAGALALVVAVFVINQIAGIFGGFAAAVGDVARGDFGGTTPKRSKKVNCHNCRHFHIDNNGKNSCYVCGRLGSTNQSCPYYDER